MKNAAHHLTELSLDDLDDVQGGSGKFDVIANGLERFSSWLGGKAVGNAEQNLELEAGSHVPGDFGATIGHIQDGSNSMFELEKLTAARELEAMGMSHGNALMIGSGLGNAIDFGTNINTAGGVANAIGQDTHPIDSLLNASTFHAPNFDVDPSQDHFGFFDSHFNPIQDAHPDVVDGVQTFIPSDGGSLLVDQHHDSPSSINGGEGMNPFGESGAGDASQFLMDGHAQDVSHDFDVPQDFGSSGFGDARIADPSMFNDSLPAVDESIPMADAGTDFGDLGMA